MELLHNQHVEALTKIIEEVGERVEGNLICDIHARNWTVFDNLAKIRNLQRLCKDKKKIVEIGVNACHSLLIMLLENPNADYLLFDLNNHKYTEPALDYIKRTFASTKITVVFGDSVGTVAAYIETDPNLRSYDFVHLDGGHTEDVFGHDYEHCKRLLAPSGIVVFDDYNMADIRRFLQQKVLVGEIVEYLDHRLIPTDLHFVYQYADGA